MPGPPTSSSASPFRFSASVGETDLREIADSLNAAGFEILEANREWLVAIDFGVTIVGVLEDAAGSTQLRVDAHLQPYADRNDIVTALNQMAASLRSFDFTLTHSGKPVGTFAAGEAFELPPDLDIKDQPVALPVVNVHSDKPGPGSVINYAQVHFDDRVERADIIGVNFSACRFENWFIAQMPNPGDRPRIQNVHVSDTEFVDLSMGGPLIVDTTFENITGPLTTAGAAFRHVRLVGVFDQVQIEAQPNFVDPAITRAWDRANERFNKTTDWALDIREASFVVSPDLSGLPGYLVAWENTPSIFVEAHKVDLAALTSIDFGVTHWDHAIKKLTEENRSEVLVAPELHEHFEDYMRVIAALVDSGIAVAAPRSKAG